MGQANDGWSISWLIKHSMYSSSMICFGAPISPLRSKLSLFLRLWGHPNLHFWSGRLAVVLDSQCNQLVTKFCHYYTLNAFGLSLCNQSTPHCWLGRLSRLSQGGCLKSLPFGLNILRVHNSVNMEASHSFHVENEGEYSLRGNSNS